MEKSYIIKVLAKKDAKLNYRYPINLTKRLLAQKLQLAEEPKIILQFRWFRPTQEVFESIYLSAVQEAKNAFQQYEHLVPGIASREILSFRALYKGIMNIFVKIDDEVLTNGEDIIAATDFANLLIIIISEVIKTTFIKTSFYDEHLEDLAGINFIIHILAGLCLGIAHWFGFELTHQERLHELIKKMYLTSMNKVRERITENFAETLQLLDSINHYIEESSYLIVPFNQQEVS